MLKEFLQIIGFSGNLHQAYSLKDAKSILKSNPISYILCDLDLPDGKGVSLLKEIREIERFKDLPFLMITGHNDVDSMISCSKQGVSDYLVKPFTFENLKDKLVDGWNSHQVKEANKDDDYICVLESERERLLNKNKELEEELKKLKRVSA